MIKQNIITCIILTLLLTNVTAQSINQLDENGARHGYWKMDFEKTDQPRYEGLFDHGHEVGTFKFYKFVAVKRNLSATREFLPNSDKINVKFFSSKGKLISEGSMNDKIYVGKWVYYQNKTDGLLMTEHYDKDGMLSGEKLVFYENGQIAEKSFYLNGQIDGISTWYSPEGKVLKEFTYMKDQLHGISKYYDSDGILLAEGMYKNDKKYGIWKYYENGALSEEKDFTTYSKNPKKQKQ